MDVHPFIPPKYEILHWFFCSSPGRFFITTRVNRSPERHRWEELCCELPWPAPWEGEAIVRLVDAGISGTEKALSTSLNTVSAVNGLDFGRVTGRTWQSELQKSRGLQYSWLHFEICSGCTRWLQSSFVKHDWKNPICMEVLVQKSSANEHCQFHVWLPEDTSFQLDSWLSCGAKGWRPILVVKICGVHTETNFYSRQNIHLHTFLSLLPLHAIF